MTTLLVDDDRAIRTLAKTYLERAGYTVLTASDGEEGLSVFRRYQDHIALVVTDVRMPKLDGLRLADSILSVRPTLPVIFISGDIHQADRGWGCIAKPFTQLELLARVRQVLSSGK